jgi:hypothetical protein
MAHVSGASEKEEWQCRGSLRCSASHSLAEFGPRIALLLLSWSFGVKVANAGTLTFVPLDRARRWWTAVFGTVDRFAASPFMLKYDAVITNVATGVAFVIGAYGKTPLLQEIAEQRQGAPSP